MAGLTVVWGCRWNRSCADRFQAVGGLGRIIVGVGDRSHYGQTAVGLFSMEGLQRRPATLWKAGRYRTTDGLETMWTGVTVCQYTVLLL
jgi:hypothetical protein